MTIDYSIIETKSGLPSLEITLDGKTMSLHSKIDPSREKNLIDDSDAEKYDCIICLGIGLAYHLQNLNYIAHNYKKIILIDVIDDIPSLLKENSEFILEKENITIISGKKNEYLRKILSQEIDLISLKGIKVVEHIASLRIFAEYYLDAKKIINEILNAQAGSEGAKKSFGKRYLKNALINLKVIEKKLSISLLKEKHKNSRACVITSGPSLESHIEWIKENKDSLVIIAVDSALKPLLAHDIKPQYLVSIDPQPYVYEHLQDEDFYDINLIASLTVHPLVMKKAHYVFLNSHPLCQLVEEIDNGVGSIDSSSGSVAGDAIALSSYLGCKETILFGFDFSFIKEVIYCRETAYQRRFSFLFQNRLITVENQNFSYIMKSSKDFRVHGFRSRKSFLQYKESIDQMLKNINNNLFFQPLGTQIPLTHCETVDLNTLNVIDNVENNSNSKNMNLSLLQKNIMIALKDREIFKRILEASSIEDKNAMKYQKILI